MTRHMTKQADLIVPSHKDARLAEESSQVLASFLQSKQAYMIQLVKNKEVMASVKLPTSAYRLLVDILTEMAAGHAITLVPYDNELGTQAAADLLNVSRPYFVKLLEAGTIPFHKVGKHRRVLAKDVLSYKEDVDKAREETLRKLTAQAQKLKMGYEDE